VIRYNKLLVIMAEMLINVQKAVKGEVVMSVDLDKMSTSLFNNQVPLKWAPNVGFLSLKPLASWTQDLNDRISFLKKWIEGGTPTVFWLSGLFFPQAFFTGCLQNYARKHVIAIDELDFDVKIYDEISYNDVTEKPEDGCYTYGKHTFFTNPFRSLSRRRKVELDDAFRGRVKTKTTVYGTAHALVHPEEEQEEARDCKCLFTPI
jgi:dynein heavy chain